jgi:Zn finger protein HypA/HybF involved in hydrogenase expression
MSIEISRVAADGAEPMSKRIAFQCPSCGSFNAYGTAFTRWDRLAQKWIIDSTEDTLRCEDCDKFEDLDPMSWEVELRD